MSNLHLIVDALERVRYCGVRNEILKLAHVEALSPTVDQDHRQRPPMIWGTPSVKAAMATSMFTGTKGTIFSNLQMQHGFSKRCPAMISVAFMPCKLEISCKKSLFSGM